MKATSTIEWAKKKNVFAFSKDINHLPPEIVYSIGRHRWDIDANIFMDMVKHWHLKHKTLHFENAYENMLSIRLISYLVFMFFFFRHINSRRKKKIKLYIEMAKKLKPGREIPGVLGRVSSNCYFYLLGVEKIQISPAIFTPFTPFDGFTRIKI